MLVCNCVAFHKLFSFIKSFILCIIHGDFFHFLLQCLYWPYHSLLLLISYLKKIDTQRSQTKISLAFLFNLCAMVHINEAIKTTFTSLKIVLCCVFYFYSLFLSKNVLEIKPK